MFSFSLTAYSQHPSLTLTEKGVKNIKLNLGNTPLFDREFQVIKAEIDEQILNGIDVPVPKDMAGGYTHEQHKRNYKWMHKAGNLYQFTGEKKYAEFVKEMLFEYAEMYPTLPLHPTMKSYATGKIFWQCLNDANWLVFSSQAYDCIYNYLSKTERKILEQDLFVPFANFLSVDNPKFFNRIHNHSTWANAAVGLCALAINNDELLDRALYGLKDDGIDPNEIDNDGGYIKMDGVRQAGFLAQLDYSFSPEGYFTEGPYYLRYAIFPFLVFGHALHNNKPELKIFEYRDQILKKATKNSLQLTDPQGSFYPINDSQKGMNYTSFELVTAVDLMLYIDEGDTSLLDWAALQETVAFNETGFYVAQKLAKQKMKAPVKSSLVLGDGVDGKDGGVAVLRGDNTDVLFKYSAQGMGHGHFDRLSYSLYDEGGEVVQDYGAVRWVNLDQKGGGRYLPENKTFGKQTIAHNTVSINETSQYDGSVKKGESAHPELHFVDFSKENVQVVSAIENNAYENVGMQRFLVLLEDREFNQPLLLDIFTINSNKPVNIDLPLWFQNQILKTSFTCEKFGDGLKPLGTDNGYQHIWKEASSNLEDEQFSFNWFGNKRFYTLTGTNQKGDEIILGRAGANDPSFNLRNDPVMIHRKTNTEKAVYFNVLESHGTYSTVTEIPINPYGQIEKVKLLYSDKDYVICEFSTANFIWHLYLAAAENNLTSTHKLEINGSSIEWEGPYKLIKTQL